MRDVLLVHDARQALVLAETDVGFARREHDVERPTVRREVALVVQAGKEIGRAVEIAIVVVVTIKELVNVERAAHADPARHHLGMAEREVEGVIAPEAATGEGHSRLLTSRTNERQHLLQNVLLVLNMTPDTFTGRD